jgi:hypothetical protein
MAIQSDMTKQLRSIADNGYAMLLSAYPATEIQAIRDECTSALSHGESSLHAGDGSVYGARNVLQLWPSAASVWRRRSLSTLLVAVLGPRFGLVRVLFFDKPPGQSWALPWHRDLTIAVKNNRLPSGRFAKPTKKAGVPHIQAPQEVLDNMLTLRLHLDDALEETGPLKVIPGSHLCFEKPSCAERPAETIIAGAGDVLAMRPLLLHCSGRSHPDTRRHRRILHLEFAGTPELADGFAWHEFIPGSSPSGTIVQSAIK